MNTFTDFSLAIALLTSYMASSAKIPNYVTPCSRDSKDLNQCIVNAWEAMRPRVGEGISKLRIPPLDPFSLPEMSMNRRSDTLKLKTTMTQLTVTGLTKVRVSKLNVDLSDLSGSVSLSFANLNVTTLYVIDALLLKFLPMKGRGQYNGTINDVRVNLTGKADRSLKNKRGKSYLKLNNLKTKIFVGDAKGRFVDDTKNSQNEIFAQTANQFYENNRREVLNVLEPVFEEFCETLVLEMGNQILSTLPFEAMFVVDPIKPNSKQNMSSF